MRNPLKNAWHSLWHNPRHIVFALFRRIPWIIPNDELYLKTYYWLSLKKKLSLASPVTFNEKLQWLKLYNRRIEYVQLVDKYAVKEYVASLIGEQYVIPTIGVWDSPWKVEWEKLPNQFVLKTNHDGGGNGIVICSDKSRFSKKKALRELCHSYYRNVYLIGREWPYKKVKRRVFAEHYMVDHSLNELCDYKFFCFDGIIKAMYVATERGNAKDGVKFTFFDADFNILNIKQGHPNSKIPIKKPKSFDQMKQFASILSKGMPHVRIDFYEVDGHPYFGEFTFFHLGGTGMFFPEKWNTIFGDWIVLPPKRIERN